MRLYELTEALQHVECIIESAEGELTEETEKYLDALQMERSAKLESIAKILKNTEAQTKALKAEEERLAKKRKSLAGRTDWLKGYVLNNINASEKVEVGIFTFSVRSSQAVEVEDLEKLPDEYKRVEYRESPDKKKILEMFKEGNAVPGAHVEKRFSLQLK